MLYSHIYYVHIYTYTCRIHIDAIIKTSEDFFKKIYLSLYWKGCVWGGVGDCKHIDKDCNILTSPAPPDIAVLVLLDCSTGGLGALSAGCCSLYRILSLTHLISKLTDFLPPPSYIIVHRPSSCGRHNFALIQPVHGQGYNILIIPLRTLTNGPENKKTHDNRLGLTSER